MPTTTTAPNSFGPTIDEAVQRLTDLNDRVLASSKSAGLVSIDAYERLLEAAIGAEKKAAAATQLEWVSTAADAHTAFVGQLGKVYTQAARQLLS
jgi:hypothetical protein